MLGQIDIETKYAIIGVTTQRKGKLGQVEKYILAGQINPQRKSVILYAPNYQGTAGKSIEQAGAHVARSKHELERLLNEVKD